MAMGVAKVLILLAMCMLPALVSATRPVKNPFVVCGKVYCDTCRAGFETSVSAYIPGATVKVECKDRDTLRLVYSNEAVTDSTGAYEVHVAEDHEDQLCESILVSSPQADCASIEPGRDRARVILTDNNGISSNYRYANTMGFIKDHPLSGCTEVLKQYQEVEV
ncbi:hypothetical protein GIB67_031342 [Kingdonia uniflora]|uniref:Uncharacterized protein n=1 Tax=Kingdonia uniflora TaxID=39325 RepID=A0A7J7MGU3_9MAGN|nr:hypothetical protein GIB67_031342 [Kingdonia uniflora]